MFLENLLILLTANGEASREYMEELGGKSLFKSVPDWHERPILGSMLEHGKDVHATGEQLYFLPARLYLTKMRHK
jgi:hypothetical protein